MKKAGLFSATEIRERYGESENQARETQQSNEIKGQIDDFLGSPIQFHIPLHNYYHYYDRYGGRESSTIVRASRNEPKRAGIYA